MSEVLFHGKRKDNGEWVEGFYVCFGEKYHAILIGNLNISKGYFGFEHYEVIPETVEQYISLTDKNCKKIFGGDIVKYYNDENNDYYIGEILFVDGAFCISFTDTVPADVKDWSSNNCFPIWFTHPSYIEIIGNIHDNPELLN